jgi:hypothetical protein
MEKLCIGIEMERVGPNSIIMNIGMPLDKYLKNKPSWPILKNTDLI